MFVCQHPFREPLPAQFIEPSCVRHADTPRPPFDLASKERLEKNLKFHKIFISQKFSVDNQNISYNNNDRS